jgi:hypothetical protein
MMRMIINGGVFLLLTYVDGILLFADQAEIKRIELAFIREFNWIMMKVETNIHT